MIDEREAIDQLNVIKERKTHGPQTSEMSREDKGNRFSWKVHIQLFLTRDRVPSRLIRQYMKLQK